MQRRSKTSIGYILILILGAVLLQACSATRFLNDGEYYLDEYELNLDAPSEVGERKSTMYEELLHIMDIKPTPKMILGSRPTAWYHHKSLKDSFKLRKWLYKKVAKEPTYLRDVPLESYMKKMNSVMGMEGFYNSDISYEVTKKKHHNAKVKNKCKSK